MKKNHGVVEDDEDIFDYLQNFLPKAAQYVPARIQELKASLNGEFLTFLTSKNWILTPEHKGGALANF